MKPSRSASGLLSLLAAALLFAGGAPARAQDETSAPGGEADGGGARVPVPVDAPAVRARDLVRSEADGPLTGEDVALLREAKSKAPTVLLRSKGDLGAADFTLPPDLADVPCVEISTVTQEGFDALERVVAALFPPDGGAGRGGGR